MTEQQFNDICNSLAGAFCELVNYADENKTVKHDLSQAISSIKINDKEYEIQVCLIGDEKMKINGSQMRLSECTNIEK
jgi:hypothetical protein